jgi:predicted phage replisome organizer
MSDIKWIKITTNIFDDDKIKLIEKLPEGDTMLIIWLKLLTLAGKKNDCGLICLTRDIPYSVEMLADVMNRDHKIISLALNTFKSFEMIKIFDNFIQIINWEKHQNIEGMEKIKTQNRIRQANYRNNKENSNVIVTLHNGTDKIRLDKIRIEENKENKEKENEDINNTPKSNLKEKEEVKVKVKEFVCLKESELKILKEKYSAGDLEAALEKLNYYKMANGKKYKSDYGALNQWVFESLKCKPIVNNIDIVPEIVPNRESLV